VVTAFGRLGHVFASGEVFGLDPDMIAFAKGVTSGYFPLGGVVVSGRLLEELRRSNHPEAMFAHGLTYTSHPVGCAVALKNLDLLEEGVLAHAPRRRALFPGAAEGRWRTCRWSARCAGSAYGLRDCVDDRDSRNRCSSTRMWASASTPIARNSACWCGRSSTWCVMSPRSPSTGPDRRLVAILREGISRTMDDLRREGVWQG